MNKLSQKARRRTAAGRRLVMVRRLAAAVITLGIISAAAAAVTLTYRAGLWKLPGFIDEMASSVAELFRRKDGPVEIMPGDDGRIYEALKNSGRSEGVSVVKNITAADAVQYFSEMTPAATYTFFNRVTLKAEGGSVTRRNKIWRDGAEYRVEIYDESDKLKKSVVCDGEKIYVTDYSDPEPSRAVFSAGGNFALTLEEQAGIPSVSDIKKALGAIVAPTEETSAGADFGNGSAAAADTQPITEPVTAEPEAYDIFGLEISLARLADTGVYNIKYTYAGLPLGEELYVSLRYGLIVRAETRASGEDEPYYLLTTDYLGEGITGYDGPSGEIFSAPPGES